MKKYNLKIKNNETQLNEVEIGIDQIVKSTGIGDTANALTQLVKTAAATVKLALGVVFSFRSLSLKKISENINEVNKKYSRRVRSSMRELDKTIDNLSQNSMVGNAFMFTTPFLAVTDYLRKEVDNAGGLKNYLEDQSQNLIVGDTFESLYNVYEGAIKKSMDIKGFEKELTEDEIKRQIIMSVKKDFRVNFGQESVDIMDDIINGKETQDADRLLEIISREDSYKSKDKFNKALYDFFNEIKNKNQSTTESYNITKSKIIISEKQTKKVSSYTKEQKIAVVIAIADLLDYQEKIVQKVLDKASNVKSNLEDDIKSYSNILEVLICDYVVLNLVNNFLKYNDIKEQDVKTEIKNISNVKIEKDSKKRIDQLIRDMFSKFDSKNKKDTAAFLLGSIKLIEDNNIYKDKKIKDYIESINKYSNSKDNDFTKLKSGFNKIYEKNSKVNISEAISRLNKLITKLGSEDEDN